MSSTEEEPFLQHQNSNDGSDGAWNEKESESHRNRTTPRSNQSISLRSYCICVVVTSLIWTGLFWTIPRLSIFNLIESSQIHNSTIFPDRNYYHCGRSIAEAQSRGCTYDVAINHYIPDKCIDVDAIRDYQEDGSWFGYADANHTQLLSYREMANTPLYYTNMRDHIVHCAVLWRRQFRALMERPQYVDSLSVDKEHMLHCSKFLIDMTEKGIDFRKIPIEVEHGYAGCHVRE